MNVKEDCVGEAVELFLKEAVKADHGTNKVISGEDNADKSPEETGLSLP